MNTVIDVAPVFLALFQLRMKGSFNWTKGEKTHIDS